MMTARTRTPQRPAHAAQLALARASSFALTLALTLAQPFTRTLALTLAIALAAPAAAWAQDAERGRDLYLDAGGTKGIAGLPSCVQCHGLPPEGKLIGASPAQLQGAFASVIAMGRFALEFDARDLADLSAFLRDPQAVATPLPAVSPLSPAWAALPGTRSPGLALRLTNDGRAALTLAARDAVTVAGTGASQFVLTRSGCDDGVVLAPGASCEVTLQYAPPADATPPPEAQLQWRYARIAQPTVIALAAQPRDVAALSLSAGGLSFGAAAHGTTASRSLRIDNGGQGVLALDVVALSGPAATEFTLSGCRAGDRLAPGAGCALTVAFTPAAAGTRQAQLVIDGSGGRRVVALVGEGAAASTPPAPVPAPPPPPATAPPAASAPPAGANAGGGGAAPLSIAPLLLPLALWRRRRI
jgi:cytochrome c553